MSFGSPYGPYQSEAPSSFGYQGEPPGFEPPYYPYQGSQSMQPGFQGVPPPGQYYDQPPPPPPVQAPRQQQRRRQAPQFNVQKIQKMTINKPVQQQKVQQPKKIQQQKTIVSKVQQQQNITRAFQNLRIKNLPPRDNRDPIITLYNKPLVILSQSDIPDFVDKKNQLKLDRKFSDKAIVFRMDDGSFLIMFSSVRDKNGRREFMPVRIYLPQNA